MESSVIVNPTFIERLLNTNKWLLFFLWILLNFIVVYLNQNVIFTSQIYYNTYGEKIAFEKIESFLKIKTQLAWLGYVFVPVILVFQMFLVTLTLNIGTLLGNVKLGFGKLFGIVVAFEGIFILANILRCLWIRYFINPEVLTDIQYFYPFSALNFFGPDTLPSWLTYPIYLINLFEVAFIFLLAKGIQVRAGMKFGPSLFLVISSYGIGLVIWATLIALLTISYT